MAGQNVLESLTHMEKLEKAMNDAESRVTAAGVSVDMGGNR